MSSSWPHSFSHTVLKWVTPSSHVQKIRGPERFCSLPVLRRGQQWRFMGLSASAALDAKTPACTQQRRAAWGCAGGVLGLVQGLSCPPGPPHLGGRRSGLPSAVYTLQQMIQPLVQTPLPQSCPQLGSPFSSFCLFTQTFSVYPCPCLPILRHSSLRPLGDCLLSSLVGSCQVPLTQWHH